MDHSEGVLLRWFTSREIARDRFIQANGLRLHYLEWGAEDAPPIVLLHGLRGSARTWESLAEPLSTGYRLIALDQRGRGESDWALSGEYTHSAYLADLEQVVDQAAPGPFVLIGHSSDILLPSVAQAMCEANPHIKLVDIPGAGHSVHDDNFPAFR